MPSYSAAADPVNLHKWQRGGKRHRCCQSPALKRAPAPSYSAETKRGKSNGKNTTEDIRDRKGSSLCKSFTVPRALQPLFRWEPFFEGSLSWRINYIRLEEPRACYFPLSAINCSGYHAVQFDLTYRCPPTPAAKHPSLFKGFIKLQSKVLVCVNLIARAGNKAPIAAAWPHYRSGSCNSFHVSTAEGGAKHKI